MPSHEQRTEPDDAQKTSPHTGRSAASGPATTGRGSPSAPGAAQEDAVGWSVVVVGALSMLGLAAYIVFLLLSLVFDWA